MEIVHNKLRNTDIFEEAVVEQSDAEKYGIAISSTLIFKGAPAHPGNVYFVATFVKTSKVAGNLNGQKFSEAYQVVKKNIEKYGRELCERSVITQVVARHFINTDVN